MAKPELEAYKDASHTKLNAIVYVIIHSLIQPLQSNKKLQISISSTKTEDLNGCATVT